MESLDEEKILATKKESFDEDRILELRENFQNSKPNKALQLFKNDNKLVILDPLALKTIAENFDPYKEITVIIAAGFLGTGKSTWSNSIIYNCLNEKDNIIEIFQIGHTIQTQTEGIWIYPNPLFRKNNPNVQIMLLDIEGIGGIKEQTSNENVKICLNRILTIAFSIASVFTIHSHFKINSELIESLSNIYHITQMMDNQIKTQVPSMYLLVQDIDDTMIINQNKDFENTIAKFLKSQELLKKMKIIGKNKPPKEFLVTKTANYSLLEGSSYMRFIENFLDEAVQIKKLIPGSSKPIKLEDLLQMITQIAISTNSENSDIYFKCSIENTILDLVTPLKLKYFQEFISRSMEIAEKADLSNKPSQVDKMIKNLKNELLKNFDKECKEIIKKSKNDSEILRNQYQQLNVLLLNSDALQYFMDRILQNKKDENIRSEIEKEKRNLEANKELAQKAMENLQKNLEFEQNNTKESLRLLDEEFQKKLEEYNQSQTKMINGFARFIIEFIRTKSIKKALALGFIELNNIN